VAFTRAFGRGHNLAPNFLSPNLGGVVGGSAVAVDRSCSGIATAQLRHLHLQSDSPVIALVIVVVIIPIMFRVPAMLVFIPPTMVGTPAVLTRFVQIVAAMLGLLAPVAVTLDGFVKPVIGSGDASLAVVIGAQARRTYEHKKASQCRSSKCDPSN